MNDPLLASPARSTPRLPLGWIASAFVVAILLLNLLVIDRFELGVDEAHYALYGLYLDWSYFDHPPLIGWLQAIALRLSEDPWALRLWGMLCSLLSCFLLYRLVKRLYPEASPLLAPLSVILLQSAVIFQLISLTLLPDTLLLPAGLMVALLLHPLLEDGESRRKWLLLGLFMGLAALAKYTAITLVVSVVLLLFIRWRCSVLIRRGIWQAVLLTLILILPIIGWNWSHDWISFLYQLDHGVPEDEPWLLARFLKSQALQLFTYGPAIYLFGLVGLFWALSQIRTIGHQYLLAFALPILLLFGWGAGFDMGLPHWTLLGWAFLTPLAAGWLLSQWQRKWLRVLTTIFAGYTLLLSLALHAELYSPWIPFEENHHPLYDLHGWDEAAAKAAELNLQMAHDRGVETRIFVGNWSQGSRIMWYARPHNVAVLDTRYDQFDLWNGPLATGDSGILIITNLTRKKAEALQQQFESCEPAGSFEKELRGTMVNRFDYYRCQGLKN
ncbi:MAG: glycosyltransferase family 39 protein [Candidatus Polarisedimenticolaceae bacterium]|nr:glycosyltransferase family 39 protein [Candidatus Polarisedimenticolaceae bacterium]